jgi:3-oxoacyl-[acyl-carrier-protein] synthase II
VPRFVHATDGWRQSLQPGTRFALPPLPILQVGEVPDEALSGEADDDRAVRIALPALVEALQSARLRPGEAQRRVDLFFVGTSLGGMNTAQALQRAALVRKAGGTAPEPAPAPAPAAGAAPPWMQAGYHGPAATLAARLHLRAHVATYNATCSSGLVALALACERIRRGEAGVAVVGGVDALCPFVYAGFHALGALASGLSAPYDAGSTGLTLAEGAGFLVVESEESAEARDAVPLAEILGVATTNDAHHLIAPHPEGRGIASALASALASAGIAAPQLGMVVGHGVGTPQSDFAELRAIAHVLGGDRVLADRVPLTSWKGALGHPLAASGPLSVIRAVAAARQRRVPPIVGLRRPVATFPVRLPKEPEALSSEHVAVLASGLGGQSSAAVMRVMTGGAEPNGELAPARARPSRPARPLRMLREEVAVVSAAVATRADLADVKSEEFERLNPAMSLRHLPEEGQLAFLAVKEALRRAGDLPPPPDDVALVAGVGHGSLAVCARFGRALHDVPGNAGAGGPASPALFAYTAANAIPAAVAASFGFRGTSVVASSGSFASAQALLDAALLLKEGRARRVVVMAFVPACDDLTECLVAGGFAGAGGDAAAKEEAPPLAAAVVLSRVEREGGVRLELRRRKRSNVTAPTAAPVLHPWLGAEALLRVAFAVTRAKGGAVPVTPLRALDPCTGAALWLKVGSARTLRRSRAAGAPPH